MKRGHHKLHGRKRGSPLRFADQKAGHQNKKERFRGAVLSRSGMGKRPEALCGKGEKEKKRSGGYLIPSRRTDNMLAKYRGVGYQAKKSTCAGKKEKRCASGMCRKSGAPFSRCKGRTGVRSGKKRGKKGSVKPRWGDRIREKRDPPQAIARENPLRSYKNGGV